jgi:predicted dehydrogenase
MSFRIGFIGTGADPSNPDTDGYAMAYRHAAGYERLDNCDVAACADIVRENAEAFADAHGIDSEHVYEDYETMLAEADLDVVSVCTPPQAHAELVVGAARSGQVSAIHCEKPMADTWADSKEMVEVCEEEGVQLTINHQMRFARPFSEAKRLVDEGVVGDVRRFEFGDSTLFDMGTHLFDLCNYYADYSPVEWVLAQIDYREENVMFGTHNENQAIAQWKYENGTYGLASTGRGDEFLDCYFRIVGDEGVIEIGAEEAMLRYRRDEGWKTVDTGPDRIYHPSPGRLRAGARQVAGFVSESLQERLTVPTYTARAIEELIESLETGTESALSARRALPAEELIFASWESARRRGRVDLPLDIDGNPLEEMVESGELTLEPAP